MAATGSTIHSTAVAPLMATGRQPISLAAPPVEIQPAIARQALVKTGASEVAEDLATAAEPEIVSAQAAGQAVAPAAERIAVEPKLGIGSLQAAGAPEVPAPSVAAVEA